MSLQCCRCSCRCCRWTRARAPRAYAAPGAPRLGLGPYRYDEECMRGAVTSGVSSRPLGTGFPTLLALSGTFNVTLLAAVAAVGAKEVRSYYNIEW
jgi:beta-glucosidase-like glycosyl hydrolase